MDPIAFADERTVGVARRVLARMAAACLLLCAVGGALGARWDMRAAALSEALDAVEAAPSAAERTRALAAGQRHARGGAPSGDLASVTARWALVQEPADLPRAEDAITQALTHAPTRPHAWARLAATRAQIAGAMTPEASEALRYSFLVAAFGPRVMQKERLLLALRYWDALEASLQRAALRQVEALWADPENAAWLRDLLAAQPAGAAREALSTAMARADFGR